MATIKFVESFVKENLNKTVRFNYAGIEGVGVIIGYWHNSITVLTDHVASWELAPYNLDSTEILSKEPILDTDRAMFIAYDTITEFIEDDPVVAEAESVAKRSIGTFLYAIIAVLFILLCLMFLGVGKASAQVSVSKEKTEVLASVRLGNAKFISHEAQYAITMTDKTDSGIKSRLQLSGYSFDSGTVVLVLGDKETAIGVLEYLANNKPAKGEEVTIAGNEGTIITYSGLFGGWQFHQDGMVGNLGQGEAKKFLKVLNK